MDNVLRQESASDESIASSNTKKEQNRKEILHFFWHYNIYNNKKRKKEMPPFDQKLQWYSKKDIIFRRSHYFIYGVRTAETKTSNNIITFRLRKYEKYFKNFFFASTFSNVHCSFFCCCCCCLYVCVLLTSSGNVFPWKSLFAFFFFW